MSYYEPSVQFAEDAGVIAARKHFELPSSGSGSSLDEQPLEAFRTLKALD
jgi:hypothetical protein